MELREFQGHIRTLASLPETRAPVVSCYLRVEGGRLRHRRVFTRRIEEIKRSFAGEAAQLFEEALAPIERFLSVELQRGSKGVAVFSRSGRQPFFLALQFYVPLPTWHLVELKDTYWRFVVLVCSQDTARIVSVNLGAVTLDLLREKPELRQRVGREWTAVCRRRDQGAFPSNDGRQLRSLDPGRRSEDDSDGDKGTAFTRGCTTLRRHPKARTNRGSGRRGR